MTQPYTTFFESSSITATTTGAGADVVYTVPSNFDAEITLLDCTNGGANHTVSVQIYHADDAEYYYLLRSHSIAGGEAYKVITGNRLFLHSGDKIVAYKSAGTLDVSVSGKQYFNPTRT